MALSRSVSAERIAENFAIFDFEVSPEDRQRFSDWHNRTVESSGRPVLLRNGIESAAPASTRNIQFFGFLGCRYHRARTGEERTKVGRHETRRAEPFRRDCKIQFSRSACAWFFSIRVVQHVALQVQLPAVKKPGHATETQTTPPNSPAGLLAASPTLPTVTALCTYQ